MDNDFQMNKNSGLHNKTAILKRKFVKKNGKIVKDILHLKNL
jgi:hypothetical protein